MKFNYQEISQNLLNTLPSRTKDVLERRFALSGNDTKETLESIGEDYDICRERVRQIENKGIKKLKEKVNNYKEVFKYFKKYLKDNGGLKREDLLLEEIGEGKEPQVFFLLNLGKDFIREKESEELLALWTLDEKYIEKAKELISFFEKELERKGDLITLEDVNLPSEFKDLEEGVIYSYIEISQNIGRNAENEIGSTNWPEINPKRVKDKAYLVLKQKGEPLHFKDVATNIGDDALPQTVHNELIRDERFVLIGRGMYALKEWGYKPGTVAEVIERILKEADRPLTRGEIVEKVLDQRLVKESTIILNLSRKDNFLRNDEGRYQFKNS